MDRVDGRDTGGRDSGGTNPRRSNAAVVRRQLRAAEHDGQFQFQSLEHADSIDDLHVMLQREVVERIAAEPGSGDYGRLTVMLAPRMEIEHLFDVGPGAFRPPPKVWSAVVRLRVRSKPAFAVSPHFAQVVATAFAHRRKTIRNALRSLLAMEQIEAAGIDPGVRPETLPAEAFNRLAERL